MIDFSKFGFAIAEFDGKRLDDAYCTQYENDLFQIIHWKKPSIFTIAIRRERFLEPIDEYDLLNVSESGKIPNSIYKIKEGIGESERKLAQHLLKSNFYVFPLYVGEIKDETFFEILINSICTDADRLIQCGS